MLRRRRWHHQSLSNIGKPVGEGSRGSLFPICVRAVMAGQITALVNEIRPVAKIIDDTIAQAKEILAHITEYQFN